MGASVVRGKERSEFGGGRAGDKRKLAANGQANISRLSTRRAPLLFALPCIFWDEREGMVRSTNVANIADDQKRMKSEVFGPDQVVVGQLMMTTGIITKVQSTHEKTMTATAPMAQ